MILDVLFIVLGFVLLIKGGDWLVDGSVCIARRAKLSPMVIGITVIGFGTSAPELFVSLKAALAQSPGLSIGNVVGSNIANIALILGATAIIIPCTSKRRTLRVDLPVMICSCVALTMVGKKSGFKIKVRFVVVIGVYFFGNKTFAQICIC